MSPTPTRRSFRVPDGPTLSMLDWGRRGPLCVLLHANGFCARTWSMVAAGLAHDHHVVALDSRGHGDSERVAGPGAYDIGGFVGDVSALLAHLTAAHGGEPVALLAGHSWGGAVALRHAIAEPSRVARLMLLDPVILPAELLALRPPGDSPLAVKALRRRAVFDSRDQARRLWTRNAFFRDFHPRVLDDYLAGGLRDRPDGKVELCCPPEVEAAVFNGPPSDPAPEAHRVSALTRVLRAAGTPFPPQGYERVVAAIPRATMQIVQAGHLIPMEQPIETAAAMRALLHAS